MTTSALITRELQQKNISRKGDGAIYAVLLDGNHAHCMTESMLDIWFVNQAPELKAQIYEAANGTDEDWDGPLRDMMLRSGLAPMIERINAHAEAFTEAYSRPINVKASL